RGEPLPDELRKRPPDPDEWLLKTGGFTEFKDSLDGPVLGLLNRCLSADPAKRPRAAILSARAARILLHDKHRALFVVPAQGIIELSKAKPRVRFAVKNLGSMTIAYDGLEFKVTAVEGEVWINNIRANIGLSLPACCVIGLGAQALPARSRTFITMDVS